MPKRQRGNTPDDSKSNSAKLCKSARTKQPEDSVDEISAVCKFQITQLRVMSYEAKGLFFNQSFPKDDWMCGKRPCWRHLSTCSPETRRRITLGLACNLDDQSQVLQYIKCGASLNAVVDEHGETLLHIAVRNDFLDSTEVLLMNGASPNLGMQYGNTPLHEACSERRDNLQIIQLLLSWGANPLAINQDGVTPYDLASSAAKKSLLEKWVKFRNSKIGNIGPKPANSASIPHVEGFADQPETVKLFLEGAVSPCIFWSTANWRHLKPLSQAARASLRERALHALIEKHGLMQCIEKGADLNEPAEFTLDGETLLHKTVRLGDLEAAELLLMNGASPNLGKRNGDSPLHDASKSEGSSVQMVELLLSWGANPLADNFLGTTPYTVASSKEKKTLLKKWTDFRKSKQNVLL